jgi:2-polyprenyl-6-methoxyphenol hydroxylase-like FAD-dependent oxidoreductase
MSAPKPISFSSGGPRLIIVGAGIAGLTLALHLHAHGFRNVSLYEVAPQLTPLGVGINIQPSAIVILRYLGLLEGLQKVAIQTEELVYYNRHGNLILKELRGKRAGYDVPQFSCHRGELQMLLLEAVRERLGEDSIKLGRRFESWKEDELGITAKFSEIVNGQKKELEVQGDSIVACDGINSTARALLYPHEGPPQFSGRMLWRGCIKLPPTQEFLTGASMVWGGHADQKFIAYPISGEAKRAGTGSLVNWICELRTRTREECEMDDRPPEKTDWTASVDKEKFLGPFKGWKMGGLDVDDLVRGTADVFEFPMCDRFPVQQWTFGRLTLMGDAAHPMYPSKFPDP